MSAPPINLARRLAGHKGKLLPSFTRKCDVDQLVYFEAFDSILEARAREQSLKRRRRARKIELIAKLHPDWRDLTSQLNL
jgi:putative endonuclease